MKSSKHKIAAVVDSWNPEGAKKLAIKFSIPKVCDSYEQLLADEGVNIVHVGTINPTHRELCLKAIAAGKHVVNDF